MFIIFMLILACDASKGTKTEQSKSQIQSPDVIHCNIKTIPINLKINISIPIDSKGSNDKADAYTDEDLEFLNPRRQDMGLDPIKNDGEMIETDSDSSEIDEYDICVGCEDKDEESQGSQLDDLDVQIEIDPSTGNYDVIIKDFQIDLSKKSGEIK